MYKKKCTQMIPNQASAKKYKNLGKQINLKKVKKYFF